MKPIVRAPSLEEICGSKKKKTKCITRSWDLNIPSEILQEILSRLGPKANIRASVVCKTWFEAVVSVRKSQPLPWLFYPSRVHYENYILFDPSSSQTHKQNFPDLKGHALYSMDGWLLAVKGRTGFFLNPYTKERIDLPKMPRYFSGYCLAFSAAPTSTSCLVVSFRQLSSRDCFLIATWTPDETVWTIHRYWNLQANSFGRFRMGIFSNGLFYALSYSGNLGVFDPSKATWDVLPVKPCGCDSFCKIDFSKRVVMMEHDGNIFLMARRDRDNNNRPVFKLNCERMVWEDKTEVCGLALSASLPASLTRSCPYPWTNELLSIYYSLVDHISYRPPTSTSLDTRLVWVDPPQDDVNL